MTQRPGQFPKLAQQKTAPAPKPHRSPADELDRLIDRIGNGPKDSGEPTSSLKTDPIESLRSQLTGEFIPLLESLVAKYSSSGIVLEMDASNFLNGGRTIKINIQHGRFRSLLEGTVTSDMIAFLETRYSPISDGHLMRGPALRLRGLTAEKFRDFICERLTVLLKLALDNRNGR